MTNPLLRWSPRGELLNKVRGYISWKELWGGSAASQRSMALGPFWEPCHPFLGEVWWAALFSSWNVLPVEPCTPIWKPPRLGLSFPGLYKIENQQLFLFCSVLWTDHPELINTFFIQTLQRTAFLSYILVEGRGRVTWVGLSSLLFHQWFRDTLPLEGGFYRYLALLCGCLVMKLTLRRSPYLLVSGPSFCSLCVQTPSATSWLCLKMLIRSGGRLGGGWIWYLGSVLAGGAGNWAGQIQTWVGCGRVSFQGGTQAIARMPHWSFQAEHFASLIFHCQLPPVPRFTWRSLRFFSVHFSVPIWHLAMSYCPHSE